MKKCGGCGVMVDWTERRMNRNGVADLGHNADGHMSNSEYVFLYKWHLFMGMMRMNSGGGQGIYCRGGGIHGRRKSGMERRMPGIFLRRTYQKTNEFIPILFTCIHI